MAPPKRRSTVGLKTKVAAVNKAANADAFADAVQAALGAPDSILWVEARAMWKLIETNQLTRVQVVEALAKRSVDRMRALAEALQTPPRSTT